jgi:hypothetical protein
MMTFAEPIRSVPGSRVAKEMSGTATGASEHEFRVWPANIRCRDHETLTARGWLSHYNESWPNDQHIDQTVAITYGQTRIMVMAKRPIRDQRWRM